MGFSAFISVFKNLGRLQRFLGGAVVVNHLLTSPTRRQAALRLQPLAGVPQNRGYNGDTAAKGSIPATPIEEGAPKITGKYISFRSASCCLRPLLWLQVFVSLLSPVITAAASPASCGRTHLRGILGLTDVKKTVADAAKNPSKVEKRFLPSLYRLMCRGVPVRLIMSDWDLQHSRSEF